MELAITDEIYHDEDAARAHLEKQRWPNGPVCPHCGSFNATATHGNAHRKGLYQCNEPECREQFSVTVGTALECSKVPLRKWVLAAQLMGSSKKGVSPIQIQRTLGVTYETAWFMSMRLRKDMSSAAKPDRSARGGPVSADRAAAAEGSNSKTIVGTSASPGDFRALAWLAAVCRRQHTELPSQPLVHAPRRTADQARRTPQQS